jgi:hypothetical protein
MPVRRGKLVYVDADHGHPNICVPSCNYACQPFTVRLAGSRPLSMRKFIT